MSSAQEQRKDVDEASKRSKHRPTAEMEVREAGWHVRSPTLPNSRASQWAASRHLTERGSQGWGRSEPPCGWESSGALLLGALNQNPLTVPPFGQISMKNDEARQ